MPPDEADKIEDGVPEHADSKDVKLDEPQNEDLSNAQLEGALVSDTEKAPKISPPAAP